MRTDEVTELVYEDAWHYLSDGLLDEAFTAGKFDALAAAALEEHRRGETVPLEADFVVEE